MSAFDPKRTSACLFCRDAVHGCRSMFVLDLREGGSRARRVDPMRRREFISLIGAAAGTWPLAVQAQTKKRPLVGWLWYSEADIIVGYLQQLLRGMQELGLIEGQHFDMVYRSSEFHLERLARAA